MSKITLGLALTSAIALSSPALAAYPEQPIQLIIAYGAGGATDLSGRALATALGPKVPQPILPVNRTGAGGATGTASRPTRSSTTAVEDRSTDPVSSTDPAEATVGDADAAPAPRNPYGSVPPRPRKTKKKR